MDVNAVSPVWAITIALIVTLVFTTYRTMLKALELRRKELDAEGGGPGLYRGTNVKMIAPAKMFTIVVRMQGASMP